MPLLRNSLLTLVMMLLTGCSVLEQKAFEADYGKASVVDRQVDVLSEGQVDYWHDVKPVLDARCVACHACYDAPCQLKLGSIEGIDRGASEQVVYNQSRLTSDKNLSRLFEDALSTQEWRLKDFYPVLNEHKQTPEANKQASVMYQMLLLKEQHPLPNTPILNEKVFDLSLDKSHQCTKNYKFDEYQAKYPKWGMPYALPGLPEAEQATLKKWIEQGGKYTARPALAQPYQASIKKWEAFLNQDSLKGQLVSRYIFEHLVVGHLYFSEIGSDQYFKIVRSATPPGKPLSLISTRRPYDDPQVARVYYRLTPYQDSRVLKTHMPYALDSKRMRRWQSLFFDREYEVTHLPSYDPKESANPFKIYEQLPYRSKYKFLLDEAEFTIMGFMKGPVCRGQVALNVIRDHFWVYFIDPEFGEENLSGKYLKEFSDLMSLPSGEGSIYRPLTTWTRYADQQLELVKKRDEAMAASIQEYGLSYGLDVIWDGHDDLTNEYNPNASLTIFRHFDSAFVKKGTHGRNPKTAWIISYQLLERIHYLLVAGYDVYGNVGHQLITRVYMDFLRLEGENTFLFFLPNEKRHELRQYWYDGASPDAQAYLELHLSDQLLEPNIEFKSNDQQAELYSLLEEHLDKAAPKQPFAEASHLPEVQAAAEVFNNFTGKYVDILPQASVIHIEHSDKHYYFTLIQNNEHKNVLTLFKEADNLIPEADYVSTVPGIATSYPNQFFSVNLSELPVFAKQLSSIKSQADYKKVVDTFGVRRTQTNFWEFSDKVHRDFKTEEPITYGILDYNRLENR